MKDRYHLSAGRHDAALSSALSAAAAALEADARRLRQQADTLDHVGKWHREMAQLPEMMRWLEIKIDGGLEPDIAVAHGADHFGVRADFLSYHWRDHLASIGGVRLWARNREIVRLAHTHNNSMIGARFGLHPKSVSRIVQDMLRRSRPRPAPKKIQVGRKLIKNLREE
jgi:hypothetical protein